ncbi:MAG: hypothetical protein L3K04_00720 [Thermoplasmata archaeon]|nr:hypothetical protein [Thermoplasmata archaeon]MCI4338188.1 hypothetical protein [Thermoplasmata archaeon]MCI4340861.1 hypothetical protein [Thermoplasmata archaeon]
MPEVFVDLPPIPVLRLRADWNGGGPAAAMANVESKLPTLKGRKFYGTFRPTPEGEEYFACVARVEGDDAAQLGLEAGEIPGGWYARRKIRDWERDITQLAVQFKDMVRVLGDNVDPDRPEIEFYRSQAQMLVFVPVRSPPRPTPRDPRTAPPGQA